jgi:hypothetical protein
LWQVGAKKTGGRQSNGRPPVQRAAIVTDAAMQASRVPLARMGPADLRRKLHDRRGDLDIRRAETARRLRVLGDWMPSRIATSRNDGYGLKGDAILQARCRSFLNLSVRYDV